MVILIDILILLVIFITNYKIPHNLIQKINNFIDILFDNKNILKYFNIYNIPLYSSIMNNSNNIINTKM